jgi:uncharacterized protein YjiK
MRRQQVNIAAEGLYSNKASALNLMNIIPCWSSSVLAFLLLLCAGGWAGASAKSSGLLDGYRLVLGPVEVAGVKDDLSGITYSAHTDTLFAIQTKPTVIVELDKSGNVRRVIDLNGFEDTEDIAWVEGDRFAILEERRRTLVLVNIRSDTTVIDRSHTDFVLIDAISSYNSGPEGLAYDPTGSRFFIVKEKQPQQLYQVLFPTGLDGSYVVSTPWSIGDSLAGMIDLSGVYYDNGTGHLLVLSHVSSRLVEFSMDGTEITHLSFQAGHAGLTETIPQAEGVTMDGDGSIYICSEPNLFYVFSKSAQ